MDASAVAEYLKQNPAFFEDYADVAEAQDLHEQYVTIACVSNEVGGDLMGNALWKGVPVRDLPVLNGVSKEATAMALTFLGGLVGLILSLAISNLIMLLIPSLPAKVELWMILTSLIISVLIGLVFGVLPARKAAKLDPIECLRYE